MNLIEQIAKPIAAEIMELTAGERAKFKFPDDVNGDTYDRAMSAARMVLKAMREPTEEMRAAARKVWRDHEAKRVVLTGGNGSLAHPDWEKHYWQAMVDAVSVTEPVS